MLRLEKSLWIGQYQEIKLRWCSSQLVMNKATKGKKKSFRLFYLVFFHFLVFNKKHKSRDISLCSEKTTVQTGLTFRWCAPEASTVLTSWHRELLSAQCRRALPPGALGLGLVHDLAAGASRASPGCFSNTKVSILIGQSQCLSS